MALTASVLSPRDGFGSGVLLVMGGEDQHAIQILKAWIPVTAGAVDGVAGTELIHLDAATRIDFTHDQSVVQVGIRIQIVAE
jgi:hypothetical protein